MVDENNDSPKLLIPAGLYNVLKWIALILLPASASTYFGLGELFDLPAVSQVVGTLTTVSTFLGVLLNQSSKNFMKATNQITNAETVGKVIMEQDYDGTVLGMKMEAYKDPFILADRSKAVFDVRREQKFQ